VTFIRYYHCIYGFGNLIAINIMAVDGSENICDSKMLNTLVLVHIRHSSFVKYRLATKFISHVAKINL